MGKAKKPKVTNAFNETSANDLSQRSTERKANRKVKIRTSKNL